MDPIKVSIMGPILYTIMDTLGCRYPMHYEIMFVRRSYGLRCLVLV